MILFKAAGNIFSAHEILIKAAYFKKKIIFD
jgi:hypothetical protein